MIRDMSNEQIAVLTELTIHHGMYTHKKDDYRYDIYYKIAGELLEELIAREYEPRWIKCLTDEFVHSQLYVDSEGG